MSAREENNRGLFKLAMQTVPGELHALFEPSTGALKAMMGDDFEDDPYWIAGMKQVVAENRMCECGVTPPGWDKLIWCKGCARKEGVKALARPFTHDGEVEGCPWCHTKGPFGVCVETEA